MSILLVAEKINNQTAFIKALRESLDLSISEIRDCINTKKPFFDDSEYYEEEADEFIQNILKFAKSQGDEIKIFKKHDDTTWEITEEIYYNHVNRKKEIAAYHDELDEEEMEDDD